MRIFKKITSILIASCLMIGIANIPVYAKATAISPTKTTDAVLSKAYTTPAQAAKKATVTKTVTTKRTMTTTKKTASKKTTASSAVKKLAKETINAINKLLKNKRTSKLAKTWLNKAKKLVNSIKNGKKTNTQKKTLLNKALTAIKKVAKAKASDLSLAKQSYSSKSVFSSLKTVLKNNIIYKVYSKYTEKGLNVIKGLAKKLKLKITTVYNSFVKIGVKKAQMIKVAPSILKQIKKGENYVCCVSLAMAKYLNISVNLAAMQNLAGDIAGDIFLKYSSKDFGGTTIIGELKVTKLYGKGNTAEYMCKLSNFMSGLKAGQKAILDVSIAFGEYADHSITVVKEKNGSYGVYDINVNNGNKVVYTAVNFKKLMSGKKVKVTGETTSGKKITTTVYYKSTYNGKLDLTTNAKDVIKKGTLVYNGQ